MVVRPIALVTIAALVVVAAAAGGYLAVRDNRVSMEDTAESLVDAETLADLSVATPVDGPGTAGAVDATEAIIEDETHTPDSTPSEATEPVAPPPAPVRQEEPVVETERPAAPPPAAAPARERPGPREASQTSAGRLPEVEGWEQLSEPWPSRDDQAETRRPDPVVLRDVDRETLGSVLPPEEPPIIVEELVIAADSVIGLQVDTPVSTDTAEVEDRVEARVTRDVMVDDEIAIPAGTRVLGSVVLVERAGQLKGASRLGVRFHTVVLDDVFDMPVVTETVYREGRGRGGESAAKIGGAAVGGAILGAIFGGGRGAAIGGAAGAAGGTAAAMGGDGQAATLPAGSTLTVRLSSPATVTVER